jgi:acetolactate synthase-1/2/3 large subunit
MGYGVPAANAAKLVAPERTVVSLSGDGCFMMCSQELATAVQYGLKVIFIVVNNGMLGSIRMHQERKYPNRVIGTTIDSPDFVALAKAHHLEAQRVSNTGQFAGAMDRALLADRPCLIEIVLDPQAMTPSQDLASIRKTALQFSRG